jgi:hypothetical protein
MIGMIHRNVFCVIKVLIVIEIIVSIMLIFFEVKPYIIAHATAGVSYPEHCKAHHSSCHSEATVQFRKFRVLDLPEPVRAFPHAFPSN